MDCSICISSVSWFWISLECVLFSEFSERGREDWEAAGNKLGVRVRSGLGSLQWGTLRAQQNTQGLSSSSCNHRPFGELPTADMSETPKGQAFLIFFTRVKNGCNLQMPGLPPQWLYLPALGSFPRWGVRLKAFLQRACATILLAKWFQSSRGDVQSKTAVTHLPVTYPERCESCACTHKTALMGKVWRRCSLEAPEYSRVCYIKPLAQEHLQKSLTLWAQLSYTPMVSRASGP